MGPEKVGIEKAMLVVIRATASMLEGSGYFTANKMIPGGMMSV
jgi:hypothetical protein